MTIPPIPALRRRGFLGATAVCAAAALARPGWAAVGSLTAGTDGLAGGDTVLVRPGEHVRVAFVADNPGDWMLHCHVMEHQVGGLMTTIRVS